MRLPKLKILFLSHSSGVNGAEQCLYYLLECLDKEVFTPVVIFPHRGPLVSRVAQLGIKVIITSLSPWLAFSRETNNKKLLKRVSQIASIIEKESIDIVHTNTSVIAEGALAARMAGRLHVWHLHEMLIGHPRLRMPLPAHQTYRFIDLLSDKVIVVSESLKRSIGNLIDDDKVEVIYNGVGPDKVGEAETTPKELSAMNCCFVCTVGPVISEKGYRNLVEAAAKVIEKKRNVQFLSVGEIGDPELYETIKQRVKELSLENHFKFLGSRSDVRNILKYVDIYVCSSTMESFGLALVEAMAASKPVVATRCGGPEEITVHGKTGILVPVNNSTLMADAIVSLVNDPNLSLKIGLEGKKRYEELFEGERYCKRFEEIYLHLSRVGRKENNSIVQMELNRLLHCLKGSWLSHLVHPLSIRFNRYMDVWKTYGAKAANKKIIRHLLSGRW